MMRSIRRSLMRMANETVMNGAPTNAVGLDPSSGVTNLVKTFLIQNYSNNLNDPSMVDDLIEFLQSKAILPNPLGNIHPNIIGAIQRAIEEVKSNPQFVQPKIQKVRLVLPQQMEQWLKEYGGSNMRVPDEFLGPINKDTWNKIQVKWQTKQRMKEWLGEYGRNNRVAPPPEFTTPDNLHLFEEAKEELAAGIKGPNESWDNIAGGTGSEELTHSFLDSYPEFTQYVMDKFEDTVDPFALVKDYAFRAESGGKSKVSVDGGRVRTFQDQRLNFFWEKPEHLPSNIIENMPFVRVVSVTPSEDGQKLNIATSDRKLLAKNTSKVVILKNGRLFRVSAATLKTGDFLVLEKDAFSYMGQNSDEIVSILEDLISQRSEDVLDYVKEKISNKTTMVGGGKIGIRGPAQFAVDDQGATMDVADQRPGAQALGLDSAESNMDANIEMIRAVSGAFKNLASQMRKLSSDVVSYMRRKPPAKSESQNNTRSRRAAFIEGMTNAGMDQIEKSIDSNNKDALENIKKMGLKINSDLTIDLSSIRWSRLITMEHGARIVDEINKSAQENGQSPPFDRLPTFDQFMFNPNVLLNRALSSAKPKYREELASTYPALFTNTGGQIQVNPNPGHPNHGEQLQSFYKNETASYYKRVYVTAELAIDDVGKYLLWLSANGKYPKDIIMSFLSLIRTHTGVKQGKYPGSIDHPSPKVYRNIQEGNYSDVPEENEFLPPTKAAAMFSILRNACSKLCDLALLKSNISFKTHNGVSYFKTAGVSHIDDLISSVQKNAESQLDSLK